MVMLDRLPATVLCGIAEALCPHCTPDHQRRGHRKFWSSAGAGGPLPGPDPRLRTLAALARTCWTLNDVATRALYHEPCASVHLVRTLNEKPELCRHVTNLYIDVVSDRYNDSVGTVDEDNALLLQIAAKHAPGGLLPNPENDNEGGHTTPGAFLAADREYFVQSLLIAMCPNIQDLFASCGYRADFPFSTPGSLPRLRHLHITHTDTELGTSIQGASQLLTAAPRLESLWGYMISWCTQSIPVLPHVRELRFVNSTFGRNVLVNLLRACPNLESFAYDAGGATSGDEQFTPRQAQRALLRYAPELKHLELHFANDEGMSELQEVDEEEEEDEEGDDNHDDDDGNNTCLNSRLTALSSLETLSVDWGCLERELKGPDDAPYLASLVPRSVTLVEYFPLVKPGWGESYLKLVQRLAEAAPALLPNLQTIRLEDPYYNAGMDEFKGPSKEEARAITEATGIEVRIPPYQTYM